jgi:hypothetical protein
LQDAEYQDKDVLAEVKTLIPIRTRLAHRYLRENIKAMKAAQDAPCRTMGRNEDRKVLLLDKADEELYESSLEVGMQMNIWLVKEKKVVLLGVDFMCECQRLDAE